MNVDAGTMSPFEHGETFVLDDGGETDLDLGNYERSHNFLIHLLRLPLDSWILLYPVNTILQQEKFIGK
jgi:hypothetical protein